MFPAPKCSCWFLLFFVVVLLVVMWRVSLLPFRVVIVIAVMPVVVMRVVGVSIIPDICLLLSSRGFPCLLIRDILSISGFRGPLLVLTCSYSCKGLNDYPKP